MIQLLWTNNSFNFIKEITCYSGKWLARQSTRICCKNCWWKKRSLSWNPCQMSLFGLVFYWVQPSNQRLIMKQVISHGRVNIRSSQRPPSVSMVQCGSSECSCSMSITALQSLRLHSYSACCIYPQGNTSPPQPYKSIILLVNLISTVGINTTQTA